MHFFEVKILKPEPMAILVAELANGSSVEEVLEHLYKHGGVQLSLADVIVLRTPVNLPLEPNIAVRLTDVGALWQADVRILAENREKFLKSFVRVRPRAVHLLFSYDYAHFISDNINPEATDTRLNDLGGENLSVVVGAIRSAEIDFIVNAGRARLPPIPGVAYRAPSGELVASFLRIGNIQRSRSAIDAVFFWLLPYLRGCRGIITDTWSIASIALNASRRLASYQGMPGRTCPVEMLSVYLSGSEAQIAEVAEHIDRLIRLAETSKTNPLSEGGGAVQPKILFLMSATNTGLLYRNVVDVLERRHTPLDMIEFVALFALGRSRTEVSCLRDLSAEGGDGSFAPLDPAEPKDILDTIEIDPQTYFPSQYRDVLHKIRKVQTRNITEFLERYRDASIFRVHRDTEDDGATRHQAIWIDTVALAKHPKFQERFRVALNSLSPTPKLIVSPPHAAANELAEIAISVLRAKRAGIQRVSHANLWLDDQNSPENINVAELINELSDDDSILVLDDAFISGERLSTYHSNLRYLRFRGRIHYLVAVARPSSLKNWEERSMLIRFRPPETTFGRDGNTIAAIERFALPDWKEKDCPWCCERRQYQAVASAAQPTLMRSRSAFLDAMKVEGLEKSLFLNPPENTLHFSDCSIFGDLGLTEASVFASVASAIQMLRSERTGDKALLGPRDYPVATVLDYEEYLFTVYTDSFLRACILRAAKDFELVYTDQDSDIKRCDAARNLFTSKEVTKSDIAGEMALAFREGKFPFLDLSSDDAKKAVIRLKLDHLFDAMV